MVGVLDMEDTMQRQYTFALSAVAQGRTVLVYSWPNGKAKRVRNIERLSLVDGVLFVDGKSCAGMTVALKPYKNRY